MIFRNALSVLERGEHLLRRDEILTELGQRAKVGQGRPPKQEENGVTVTPFLSFEEIEEDYHAEGFRTTHKENGAIGFAKPAEAVNLPAKTTAQIAAEIGISENSAQKSKQIARNIIPEAKEILKDTPFASKTTELLQVSRLQPEQQKKVVRALAEGQAETVSQARRQVEREERALHVGTQHGQGEDFLPALRAGVRVRGE